MSTRIEQLSRGERTASQTIGDIASLAVRVFRDAGEINRANPPVTLSDGENYSFTRVGGTLEQVFELKVKKGKEGEKIRVGVLTFSKGVTGIDEVNYGEYTNGKIDEKRESSGGIEPDTLVLKRMELRLKSIDRVQSRLLKQAWSL